MNEAELLLVVFAVGAVVGAILLHFGHAKVSKALAVAEAKIDWIKGAPGAAVADIEAAVSKIVAPIGADVKAVAAKVDSIAKPAEAPHA